MSKYDIFKHGTNVTVKNKHTGKLGVVVEIKETFHECIEPFVQYYDEDEPIKEYTGNLEFINDGRKKLDNT